MNNFTRAKEISADAIVYRDRKKIELSNDYILPDYLADIKSVLYMKPVIHKNSKMITDGALEYDGELSYHVIFITEDDKIRSVSFDESYHGNIEMEGINDENCTAILLPCIDEFNCKLNNPRKLNMKVTINLDISVQCTRHIMPHIVGKHTPEDEISLERLEMDMDYIQCRALEENDITVSEDIILESNYPNIAELMDCSLHAYITDVRGTGGQISYRGEVIAEFLFTSIDDDADEHYHTVNKRIPIEGTFDFDTDYAKDRCRWMLMTGCPKTTVKNNELEEKRIIELDFSYDIQFICYTNETVRCVTDAYSVDCDYKNTLTPLNMMKENRQITGSVSVNESLAIQELHDMQTGEIIAASAHPQNISASYDGQKGRVYCSGDMIFELCVQINHEAPKALTFTRSFRFDAEGSMSTDFPRITADIEVMKLKCRVDDTNYYADAEIGYMISAECSTTENVLESIELNRTEQKNAKGGAYPITVYYPRKNESLWDIAKAYNTTVRAIQIANGVEDDRIENIHALMIPRGIIKPVYTKLIGS